MTDRIWLKSYPEGVPAGLDTSPSASCNPVTAKKSPVGKILRRELRDK